MTTPKFLLLLISMVFVEQVASAQESASNIAIPSKQYFMSGVESRMYVQTFMKSAFGGGDIVRFEGDMIYPKGSRREKYVALSTPVQGEKMTIKLYDGESFEVKESVETTICVADPSLDNGAIAVQFLGDSFTKGCYFKDAFLVRGYVPGVKLIGTRRVPEHEGASHEGRGGWCVETYFSNKPKSETFYNPFYQPVGEMRYWGSVEFWRLAVSLNINGGEGQSFDLRYNCGDYDTSLFGEDGLLLSPSKGDVMYSGKEGGYVAWSGRAWRGIEEPKEWSFDYGKYLKMWEFEAPQFLVVMLGLNDFRDKTLPFDFEEWNEMVEQMLSSYREAVPNGRLLLSTPCTSCGTLNNESGDFTLRQNAMMWHVRRNIIETFDCREGEGIYVVDASATIDNENGYNMRGDLQIGNPHPYPNYPQLGVPIAACVQYYRDK